MDTWDIALICIYLYIHFSSLINEKAGSQSKHSETNLMREIKTDPLLWCVTINQSRNIGVNGRFLTFYIWSP